MFPRADDVASGDLCRFQQASVAISGNSMQDVTEWRPRSAARLQLEVRWCKAEYLQHRVTCSYGHHEGGEQPLSNASCHKCGACKDNSGLMFTLGGVSHTMYM